jgi:hypothetical protein
LKPKNRFDWLSGVKALSSLPDPLVKPTLGKQRYKFAAADASPGFLLWKLMGLWQARLAREFFGVLNETNLNIYKKLTSEIIGQNDLSQIHGDL